MRSVSLCGGRHPLFYLQFRRTRYARLAETSEGGCSEAVRERCVSRSNYDVMNGVLTF